MGIDKHDVSGHPLDATVLCSYNSMYHDNLIGRFISLDTIIPDPMNSQVINS